jgi:DNA topoisomerase-1
MTAIERLQAQGIHRTGTPKLGFKYVTAEGRPASKDDLARIRQLGIPPAWTEVAVNPAATGRIQVVGKDAAGRWQYLYHDSHVRQRERKKFIRLIEFAESLPAMRAAVNRDLRKTGLEKERVIAGIIRILSMSFLRPGSEIYANENGSYGVATLRPRHVTVKGKTITFDFRGKSGVVQRTQFEDRRVSRLLRRLLKQSNRRVFKYENDEGKLIDIKAHHINDYIHQVMGHKFSAKDFRTWSGTLVCACALARRSGDDGVERSRKRLTVAAIKETAKALGNTPAVCRSAYICPAVINAFEHGTTIKDYFESVERLVAYKGTRLHQAEKALLRLLKKEVKGN